MGLALALFRKKQLEQELDVELRSHLELLAEENVPKGKSPSSSSPKGGQNCPRSQVAYFMLVVPLPLTTDIFLYDNVPLRSTAYAHVAKN